MGLFDILEDIVDIAPAIVEEATKAATSIVIRSPEIAVSAVKGVVEGVEDGFEKLGDSLDV